MATRNDEPLTTASSSASIVEYPDDGPQSEHIYPYKRSSRRAYPIGALLGLLTHLSVSGLGIAISVLLVRFHLEVVTAGTLDLVARILLFVASCMGIFYVFMHAFAAREHYVRTHGSPQIFGYFTVAVAVLIMRLGVPVWSSCVVLTALVAVDKGFNAVEGLRGNSVFVQLGIASLGLTSLILMVVITEVTERPFATLILSKRSFVLGTTEPNGRVDTIDLSVSRAGDRPEGKENGKSTNKVKSSAEQKVYQMGFDRSTINTPESTVLGPADNTALKRVASRNDNALIRVRSQPMPTPLEEVFTANGVPLDAQDSPRKLAWRPPRNSAYPPQRTQDAAVHVGNTLYHPRQSMATTSRDSSSHYSSFQAHLMPESLDPPTASEANITIPLSPALGSPTEIPATAPLRIANPDQDVAQVREEPPTLAKLLGQLSSRAAARRRNSLLVRQADLTSKPAADNSRAGSGIDMAAALFDQPTAYVQTTQPVTAQRKDSVKVRQTDLDVRSSIDITHATETSELSLASTSEFIEIPRPPVATSRIVAVEYGTDSPASPLERNDTAGTLLVRNFSRPGAPRPQTADGEKKDSRDKNGALTRAQTAGPRGRGRTQQDQALLRRSKSLPPAQLDQVTNKTEISSQFERSTSASRRIKDSQLATAPRFSAFPRAPVSLPTVGLAKVKGLGQGSTKRLDERIEKWRDGVLIEDG